MSHSRQPNQIVKGLSLLWGSALLVLPSMGMADASVPIAQAPSQPSIFNEAPYNRSLRRTPTPSVQPAPSGQPPSPEQRQAPSAQVRLVDGQATIRLINRTNAVVRYQVIGDTEFRSLQGRSEITLRSLRAPVSLTLGREDRGFLQISLASPSEGTLEATLVETTNFAADRSSLVIEPSGSVFLN
ncbi:MAG: hypothetical protein SFW36_23975 [Leptolyngbyaceae cyanobacterium bins.59]|nr:hypothetical protein [Leptolyngbyaceae cyanobacterium bins.59]